jgi:hypothetical protein
VGGTVSYDVAGYEDFRRRARDKALSGNQKAGFPDALRAGLSEQILADIDLKLPAFGRPGARVMDIGIGCSDLSHAVVSRAIDRGQQLTLVDSPEVLSQLEDSPLVRKIEGPFPACQVDQAPLGKFDAILVYSVAQYVFAESSLGRFVDAAMMLLAPEAAGLLIGDIPNVSTRRRFLDSAAGRAHHAEHYAGRPFPEFRFNVPEPGQIDDSVVLGLVARARAAGFQAFVVPQSERLPMANRREDILIRRP